MLLARSRFELLVNHDIAFSNPVIPGFKSGSVLPVIAQFHGTIYDHAVRFRRVLAPAPEIRVFLSVHFHPREKNASVMKMIRGSDFGESETRRGSRRMKVAGAVHGQLGSLEWLQLTPHHFGPLNVADDDRIVRPFRLPFGAEQRGGQQYKRTKQKRTAALHNGIPSSIS